MFYADYDFNLYFMVNVGVLHLFKQYFSYRWWIDRQGIQMSKVRKTKNGKRKV